MSKCRAVLAVVPIRVILLRQTHQHFASGLVRKVLHFQREAPPRRITLVHVVVKRTPVSGHSHIFHAVLPRLQRNRLRIILPRPLVERRGETVVLRAVERNSRKVSGILSPARFRIEIPGHHFLQGRSQSVPLSALQFHVRVSLIIIKVFGMQHLSLRLEMDLVRHAHTERLGLQLTAIRLMVVSHQVILDVVCRCTDMLRTLRHPFLSVARMRQTRCIQFHFRASRHDDLGKQHRRERPSVSVRIFLVSIVSLRFVQVTLACAPPVAGFVPVARGHSIFPGLLVVPHEIFGHYLHCHRERAPTTGRGLSTTGLFLEMHDKSIIVPFTWGKGERSPIRQLLFIQEEPKVGMVVKASPYLILFAYESRQLPDR